MPPPYLWPKVGGIFPPGRIVKKLTLDISKRCVIIELQREREDKEMVWILFIVLFCTVGAFFGVMFCNGIKNKVVRWISGILVSILVSWFVIGMIALESKIDANTWNNGICPTCEIEWTFSNADHIKNGGTNYYWHCENCNKIIEVHQQF